MSAGPARAAVLALLTLLAWGLFAPDRGFLQDEPWQLTAARERVAAAMGVLWPGHATLRIAPLRPLQALHAALAVRTPWPRLCLQLLYGAAWLATGLLAARLVGLLAPGRAAPAFAAAALALTACGDHSVNSLSYLVNYTSAAALLAALVEALAWVLAGRRRSAGWAATWLAFGLLSYDGLVAGALAAPLLLLALPLEGAARQRRRRGLVAWWSLAGLYALAFVASSLRPESYTSRLALPGGPARLAARAGALFLFNFTPWRWPGLFVRPEDGTRPEALPALAVLALVAVGVAAVLAVGARLAHEAGPPPVRSLAPAAVACLAVAAAASGGVALVVDWPFRSQAVSRVFVSLALALLLDALAWRLAQAGRRRLAAGAWLLLLPFVAGGLWAGLLSQDLYLTLWRRHRLELRSILDQVPGLRPGATLLLRLPPGAPFTSLHYLPVGSTWLSYLYGEARFPAVIWSPGGFDCRVEGEAFVCRNPARSDCYASGACQPLRLPFEATVLLLYAPAERGFVLQPRLPPDLARDPGGRYDPRAWIVPGPRTRWARELLDQPEGLAAFFPGPERGSPSR